MFNRRNVLSLIAGGALALPGTDALAQQPRTPPGQGGTPPGQAQGGGGGGKQKKHANGRNLLGEKIRMNGKHGLGKAGAKIDVSAEVRGGKVVGFEAKHADRGNLRIGKVKSTEKFAVLEQHKVIGTDGVQQASLVTVWYYAYWFTDEFGNDWYYWFPVDYIIDDGSWVIYYA
jgi:hypothetical protein